jgi:hypothetical protein
MNVGLHASPVAKVHRTWRESQLPELHRVPRVRQSTSRPVEIAELKHSLVPYSTSTFSIKLPSDHLQLFNQARTRDQDDPETIQI